ncbi:conserved hypothetical protein [Gammaproteobacteria bacterium]
MQHDHNRALRQTIIYGAISITLYISLYLFATPILSLSKQGHWFFIVPIAIAFTFSVAHGNFTSQFWDLLGIKAKQAKK